jgi:hypothetical protein
LGHTINHVQVVLLSEVEHSLHAFFFTKEELKLFRLSDWFPTVAIFITVLLIAVHVLIL